ncbi:MAG: DUF6702 family protein [Gemmatimonadaceae bacterium]
MKRARRAWLVAVLGAGVITAGTAVSLHSHPLHTTLTEITFSPREQRIQVMLRVFADDLGTAVAAFAKVKQGSDHEVPDRASYAYLTHAVALAERGGRRLPLEWCGTKRTADLVWICLRAKSARGLGALEVHNRVLFDLHDDQINIVQVTDGRRRHSLLFTKGDGPKRLP